MQFIDLKSQQKRIKPSLDKAINRVLEHGQYVMGPEVSQLEQALAEFVHSKFALTCANGTDALTLSLMAMQIGPGDAVYCPSFTYSATAESIAILGATPVFVDIDPSTYNMCEKSLERTIKSTLSDGNLRPKAVIVVDLFGQSANYPLLTPIAKNYGLKTISDAAQSFGTTLKGQSPCNWVDIMTTSFFPAKPLGCYGDGGAVFTNNKTLYESIDSLRIHGRGQDKYDNVSIGLNSRLDTLQAAILLEKLRIFPDELLKRNAIAKIYCEGLKSNSIKKPFIQSGITSSWAQFTIEVDNPDRLADKLSKLGIPTARYYPRPTHLQTAYINYPSDPNGLPHTVAAMRRVISLPMHAYLDEKMQSDIIDAISKITDHTPCKL